MVGKWNILHVINKNFKFDKNFEACSKHVGDRLTTSFPFLKQHL